MTAPRPRVTAVLAAAGLAPTFVGVPPAVLDEARRRGTAVHEAIEADAYGYLETLAIGPDVAPYLDAYRKFVAESGHEPVVSEVEVIHPTWHYVGHVDRVGWLCGRRALLDWKSADSLDARLVAYQLAGYRCAWNAMHPEQPVQITAAVQLRSDGTYRVHDVDAAAVEHVFLAALTIWYARQEIAR